MTRSLGKDTRSLGKDIAAAAALALLAVAAGTAAYRVAAPGTSEAAVSVTTVLLSADGRTLSVSRAGPCLPAAVLTSREASTAVRITLATLPHTGPCESATESRTYSTSLGKALGTRTVIDASTGREIPVFDAADMLRPASLPSGYTHIYDAALFYDYELPGTAPEAPSDDWSAACSQLFADTAGDRLWLSQSYGSRWPDGWTSAETTVQVRHRLGRARPGALAWQENGQSFLLTDAALTTAQLVSIADASL